MKNTILKSMLTLGAIAFAASITAVSCGKTPAAGGGNNNSGGGNSGGSGNATCTGICPTTNLTLTIPPVSYVKISGNTVTVNANELTRVHSDADNDNRGYTDTTGTQYDLLNIRYPGTPTPPAMFFASRSHVTKDTIAMKAVTTGTTLTILPCTSSENGDNTLASAADGAHCRGHNTDANRLYFDSYLGTVFNNTKTTSHARGLMRCLSELQKDNPISGSPHPISDTLTFDGSSMGCYLSAINSAGAATAARIDDAWVGDTASTTEVEFYAIGIDVTGKTIPQWSDVPGYGLTEFKKAIDNAAFKKLLQNNPWGELKFKVKIVTAATFATLP